MVIVDQRYVNASCVYITLIDKRVVHRLDLLSNPSYSTIHTHLQMVDVAVEGGGISGDPYGGEGHWGEWLGLANEVGSGVVDVSLSLLEHCLSILHPDSHFNCHHIIYHIKLQKTYALEVGLESGVEDVSSLARREEVVVRMCSFDTLFH